VAGGNRCQRRCRFRIQNIALDNIVKPGNQIDMRFIP
ncbi:MAG: hypothetical protein ACI822_003069, partial [Gammaproteobacteria bacterium]